MFTHSVKVPRLYKVAAKVAKDVHEGLGSIKQLVYESKSKHPNIKAIYALVATLFQRNDEIDSVLKRSQLLVKEPRLDSWLAKIFIVELLWGKKCLPGHSKPEKTVLGYEQIFKAHMSDVALEPVNNDLDIKEELKPRYVRVNTLRMNFNEAVDAFREEGWVLSKFLDNKDYKGFLDKISGLGEEEFLVDIHVPHLLIFPPKTQFYNHPAYKNGSIILQDKASCLPVHILGPPPGSVVLDMCSAPGMKTTQVAAAINNEGKVYAVERDPRRFETLNRIVEASGATCVTTINKDVIACTNKDFPEVQYILVDPSCSGSGIVGRHGYDQAKSNDRIEKLAGFQIKILRSALTRYPNVKRVVYSTCSVHPEENEDVVRQVLETNSNFKLVPAINFVNDTWKNFGSSEYGDIGSYCLYAKPNEDFTNGFFVAVFERLEEGEQNQFFNTKIYNFKKHIQNQEKRKRKQYDMANENMNYYGNNNEYSYDDSKINTEKKEEPSNSAENEGVRKKKTKHRNEINDFSNSESNIAVDNPIKKTKKEKNRKSDTVDSISEEVTSIQDTIIKQEKEELGNEYEKRDLSESTKRKYKNKNKDSEDNVIEKESSDSVTIKTEKDRKSNNKNLVHDEITKEEKELVVKEEEHSKSNKRKKKKNSKDLSEDVTLTENKSDSTVERDEIPKKKKKKNISEDADYNILKGEEENFGDTSIKEEHTEIGRQKKKKKNKDKDNVTVIEIESNDLVNNSIQDRVGTVTKEKRRKSNVSDESTKEENLQIEKRRKKKSKDLTEGNVAMIEIESTKSVENNSVPNKKRKKGFNEDVDSNITIKFENNVSNGDIIKKERKNKSNDTYELTDGNVANIKIAKKERKKH